MIMPVSLKSVTTVGKLPDWAIHGEVILVDSGLIDIPHMGQESWFLFGFNANGTTAYFALQVGENGSNSFLNPNDTSSKRYLMASGKPILLSDLPPMKPIGKILGALEFPPVKF